MKSRSTYKTNMYYFAIQSMVKNYGDDKRRSKRGKKQFDFIKSFIDSKDAEKLRESVRGVEDGKNI